MKDGWACIARRMSRTSLTAALCLSGSIANADANVDANAHANAHELRGTHAPWSILSATSQPSEVALKGDAIASRIGQPNRKAVQQWDAWVADLSVRIRQGALLHRPTAVATLDQLNQHWNRAVLFMEDADHYRLSDVWTTPYETLAQGAGDCEDYAIAKYFTLLRAGVPEQQLALNMGFYRPTGEAHITLSVTLPDGEVFILDNLNREVRAEADRNDLTPVLRMNRDQLTIFRPDYTRAAHDLARRFADMNRRYEQQLRAWGHGGGMAFVSQTPTTSTDAP